jgi:hypothetical protein
VTPDDGPLPPPGRIGRRRANGEAGQRQPSAPSRMSWTLSLASPFEIWTTVTDKHDFDASYAAIRDYIRSRSLAGQSGSPPPRMTRPQPSCLSE